MPIASLLPPTHNREPYDTLLSDSGRHSLEQPAKKSADGRDRGRTGKLPGSVANSG